MRQIALAHLLQIDFPGHTLRLCDGGFVNWAGQIFASSDPVFGSVGRLQAMGEGVGAEVPALQLTFLPPGTSIAADLVQPGYQTSRARFWSAEYNPLTDALFGTPSLLFDGQVDRIGLSVGKDKRELGMAIVARMEKAFEGRIGNSLTPAWHQSVWPGEMGHNNATGLGQPIAWGTEKPMNGYSSAPYWSGMQRVYLD